MELFTGLPAFANGLLGVLLTFRLFSSSSEVLAGRGCAMLGAAICLISGLELDPGSCWPRWTCSWYRLYFSGASGEGSAWSSLLLGLVYFGAVSGYLNFCRSRARPENGNAPFHLLICLGMLASFLWIRAGLDCARFYTAMDLRYAACEKLRQGRMEEAIPLLVKALAADPEQRDIAGDLGELYVRTGQRDLAVSVVTREVLRAPRVPGALATVYAQRGRIFLILGRKVDAYRDFQAARRWAPPGQRSQWSLALFTSRELPPIMTTISPGSQSYFKSEL